MKFVIGLIIVVGLSLGAYQFYEYYSKYQGKSEDQIEHPTAAAPAPVQNYAASGDQLPGLPPKLQPILETAEKRGASGLHDFLQTYGSQISDPRKAWIELDYVEFLSQGSPGEARHLFKEVQARTQQDSPVYGRVKQLEKTYD